jgi:hypothetical protein
MEVQAWWAGESPMCPRVRMGRGLWSSLWYPGDNDCKVEIMGKD